MSPRIRGPVLSSCLVKRPENTNFIQNAEYPLVHLSRSLKCTIVALSAHIVRRPSSDVNFLHFDISSETAERNSTNLDRKQNLNIPYQDFVFSGRSEKQRWPPWPLIGWDIFDLSFETAKRNSTKLERKQNLNVLYKDFVFRANRKNKKAALASDSLRHFRFLLWNRYTEFNETSQDARSQCLMSN